MFKVTAARSAAAAALLSLATATGASAASLNGLDFRIHNYSDSTITGIFFRAADEDDSWHAVSGNRIEAGDMMTVRVHGDFDTCEYIVKATLSDGSSQSGEMNLCRTSDIDVR
jgi:hypothetical protein